MPLASLNIYQPTVARHGCDELDDYLKSIVSFKSAQELMSKRKGEVSGSGASIGVLHANRAGIPLGWNAQYESAGIEGGIVGRFQSIAWTGG